MLEAALILGFQPEISLLHQALASGLLQSSSIWQQPTGSLGPGLVHAQTRAGATPQAVTDVFLTRATIRGHSSDPTVGPRDPRPTAAQLGRD